MSNTYKITCKIECKTCEYCHCYIPTYKYPFHCHKKVNVSMILTKPYCGEEFEAIGKLKNCKLLK